MPMNGKHTVDSSITIDNFTINASALAVLLWQDVITRAIRAGDVRWIHATGDDGVRSVLVTPASKVTAFVSTAAVPEGSFQSRLGHTTNVNLGPWAEMYIDRDSTDWDIVRALGLEAELDARVGAAGPNV